MRRAPTALILLALTGAAFAADKEGKPGTNVDMPYLMAPMTDAGGKLAGYAYISSRLTATTDTHALAVRNKLAFIQDAFVRDVNGAGVGKDDGSAVDQPALEARLLADAKRVMGAGDRGLDRLGPGPDRPAAPHPDSRLEQPACRG